VIAPPFFFICAGRNAAFNIYAAIVYEAASNDEIPAYSDCWELQTLLIEKCLCGIAEMIR
jgi:hypothetical protein